jgi:hypothetical protein
VLIGYRDPDATKATPALAPNDLSSSASLTACRRTRRIWRAR